MKNKLLQIKNLSKTYHSLHDSTLAVDDVTFDIYEKEFVAIVGPSGCGKSTILSILAGIEEKSSGEIKFNKSDVRLAYMLQKDSLFPWRTILDNCLIGLEVTHNLTEENKNYVLHLLDTYGLHDFIYKYPESLSGGMRQRVALIRTLAIKPDILLLDEATSALDYQSRLTINDDIYKIIKQEGKTAIMITHDINEAISMADRVIVLTKGPALIKKIYTIKLTNKSTPIQNRKCIEFNDYYDKIWRDLDVKF